MPPKKQKSNNPKQAKQKTPESQQDQISYQKIEMVYNIEERFEVPTVNPEIKQKALKNEDIPIDKTETPIEVQQEDKPQEKPKQTPVKQEKPPQPSKLDYNDVLAQTTQILNDVDNIFNPDLNVTKTHLISTNTFDSQPLPSKSADNSVLGQTVQFSNTQPDLTRTGLNDTYHKKTQSQISDGTQKYLSSPRNPEQKIYTPFNTDRCYFEGTLDTVTGLGDGTLYYTAPQQLRIQKFVGKLEAVTNYAPTGTGSLFIENINNQIIQYNGEIINGKLQGQGTMVDWRGEKYSGVFQNSLLNGSGMIQYTNGDVMEGNFANGLEHGVMRLCKKDGSENYSLWNYGKMVKNATKEDYEAQMYGKPLASQASDEGFDELPGILRQIQLGQQFVVEKPGLYKMLATLNNDGQITGKLMFLDNHVNKYYSGTFDKLQIKDQFVFVTGNGAISKKLFNGTRFAMKGIIQQNELFGEGEVRYENGDFYRGNFVKSELNGLGSVELEGGTMIYKGNFVNNQLTQGLVQFPSKQIQKGIFINTSLVQGQILTKRWSIKGDFKNNQLIQGVKTNRLSGNETQIVLIDEQNGIFKITTKYYIFTGTAVNGKPKVGKLIFLNSELNDEKHFLDFDGTINEISGISLSGDGTFRLKNEKDEIIEFNGNLLSSKLQGEGIKKLNNSYQKGEFEKGVLHGFGEVFNEKENTLTRGWFLHGALINGKVCDATTQKQLMSIKSLADGNTKVITPEFEAVGILNQETRCIDGKILFTESFKKHSGIQGCTGVIRLESMETEF